MLVLIVYLTGLEQHRSLYLNSLASVTVISIVMIVFITTGLYNGWKLKDSVGKLYSKHKLEKTPDIGLDNLSSIDGGDDFGEIIVSILLWIVMAIIATIVFYFVIGIIWLSILVVGSMLYWVVFRAFRLVFKKSAWCKGYMTRSLAIAFLYTLLYNCWIYAIIIGFHLFY